MNPLRYKNLFFNTNADDFALAFCQIPSDQHAQQVILDSLGMLLVDEEARGFFLEHDFERNWESFRWIFLKKILRTAMARQDQTRDLLDKMVEVPVFYQIPAESRAIIFLRMVRNYEFAEIAELMDFSLANTLSYFEAGKRAIVAHMSDPEKLVPGWKGKCLLGRKALAFVNGFGGQSAEDFFESHIRGCSSCQDLLRRNENESNILLQVIPNEKCARECLDEFKEKVDVMMVELASSENSSNGLWKRVKTTGKRLFSQH